MLPASLLRYSVLRSQLTSTFLLTSTTLARPGVPGPLPVAAEVAAAVGSSRRKASSSAMLASSLPFGGGGGAIAARISRRSMPVSPYLGRVAREENFETDLTDCPTSSRLPSTVRRVPSCPTREACRARRRGSWGARARPVSGRESHTSRSGAGWSGCAAVSAGRGAPGGGSGTALGRAGPLSSSSGTTCLRPRVGEWDGQLGRRPSFASFSDPTWACDGIQWVTCYASLCSGCRLSHSSAQLDSPHSLAAPPAPA